MFLIACLSFEDFAADGGAEFIDLSPADAAGAAASTAETRVNFFDSAQHKARVREMARLSQIVYE